MMVRPQRVARHQRVSVHADPARLRFHDGGSHECSDGLELRADVPQETERVQVLNCYCAASRRLEIEGLDQLAIWGVQRVVLVELLRGSR